MNMNFSGLIKKAVPAAICMVLFSSCQKTFDIKPEDALEPSQMYQNVYDADAVVLGIYGKFLGLAKQYILLNELRGDLMDVTPKSDAYLRELSTNNISPNNPYANPRAFYEVILNCNDALKNFDEMHNKLLLTDEQYYQRSTDLGILRCWLYLQLGIHYGKVPYVTDPIANINDLKDESKFQRLEFDQLLDKLIEYTTTLESIAQGKYLNQNTSSSSPTLIMPSNGYIIKDGVFKFFIHRRSLIGDLHLWKGNYVKAASIYKQVLETGTNLSTTNDFQIERYDTYRITDDRTGFKTLMVNGTRNPWYGIFANALTEPEANRERMWTLPFDMNYAPANPFVDLFARDRSYMARPSGFAIQNWNNQVRSANEGLTDRRGLGSSYLYVGGEPVALKYLFNYYGSALSSSMLNTTGIWILYRAATLHLRYAEAANREGKNKLASVIINDGFLAGYNGKTNLSAPFDFDATNTSALQANWYRSIGIRGRALNANVAVDSTKSFDMVTKTVINQSVLNQDTEDLIINEAALETAFEGYRWPDLLRVALRREKEVDGKGVAYLNGKISAKFAAGATGSPKAFTSTKDFYLPFNWDNK